jgi:hypothetical protein
MRAGFDATLRAVLVPWPELCPGALPGTSSRERFVRIKGLARPLRRLRRRISPLAVDLGLGAIFVLIVAVEATSELMAGARLGLLASLTLVLAACVVLRRRFPFAVLVLATVALAAESFLQVATEFSPLATLVCAYSVGQYATPARARWGTLIIVAGVVGFFAGTPGLDRTDPANLFSVLLVWLVAWGVGYSTARRAGRAGAGAACARTAGDGRGARPGVPRTA